MNMKKNNLFSMQSEKEQKCFSLYSAFTIVFFFSNFVMTEFLTFSFV